MQDNNEAGASPAPMGAGELSPPARRMLGLLRFRDGLGQSYLVHAGYGRQALVVPEMTASRSLARLDAFSVRTVYELKRRGLIIEANKGTSITFQGRRRLEREGYAVTLTDTGRAVELRRPRTATP